MRKEIRQVLDGRVVRITTADERWYWKPVTHTNPVTNLPESENIFVPSVTWIASFYPKGVGFYKWLANKGWDEAEALKTAAGDKGSKVHRALEDLIAGKEVRMESMYENPSTGLDEELSVAEYEALLSFKNWTEDIHPTFLASELTVFSEVHDFAGTVDAICTIGETTYVVDFKTSQNIWPEHKLQLSAYRAALLESKKLEGNPKLAVLRLGYRRNERGYVFTDIEDNFDLFLAAKTIWKNETAHEKPLQRDYPMSIQVDLAQKGANEDA